MAFISVYYRTREKKREDGKWRDYERYYERNELYREKYDWRRGRSKSRSKSRGLSRSRSRSRGRSKDRDPNRNAGEEATAPAGRNGKTGIVSQSWILIFLQTVLILYTLGIKAVFLEVILSYYSVYQDLNRFYN